MDEANNDFRIVSVPAKDHEPGSLRPIYKQNEHYPRLVSNNSSKSYRPVKNQKLSEPIGYIDQVAHTYGRYEASYASMNEMGLSVTESTCGAKTIAKALPEGKALFWIGELSQIALERCATVRCAVELMGNLAVKHGFYGEQEVEGSGETLLLADTKESWVFSILSTPCGSSAIWCARRVPDDHVTVVANMYTIREVDLNDNSTFLYSKNMLDIAKQEKWWDGNMPFDFTRAFSSGEYGHAYYSGRRMWRVLSLMAPSLNLDATLGVNTENVTYPWSVKVEKNVSIDMLRELNRDHYEGTPYDLTKGMAAGPFNSPNRLDGGSRFFPQPQGAWERPIAMYRTSYSLIAVR
ncbi:C69 family dipeptidase [bacterium]|nr:C69 family dipeptidase [bacterium]